MHAGPEQLRDWMARRNINQKEAAETLSVNEVFVSQLLNRHRRPGLANAIKIERVTGIPVESWQLSEVSSARLVAVGGSNKARKTKR